MEPFSGSILCLLYRYIRIPRITTILIRATTDPDIIETTAYWIRGDMSTARRELAMIPWRSTVVAYMYYI
jgi:hypothetical protein